MITANKCAICAISIFLSVHTPQQNPQKRHLLPRVLEYEGVVFRGAAQEVRSPHHGNVLKTHLSLADVIIRHKLLEEKKR